MTYEEAIDIRLRDARRQFVPVLVLAKAHRVVAAVRAGGKPKTRCEDRCEQLGICQSYEKCAKADKPNGVKERKLEALTSKIHPLQAAWS